MSSKEINLHEVIIKKTFRVPLTGGGTPAGNTEVNPSGDIALQFDGVLIENGFKASSELLRHIASEQPASATYITRNVLGVIKKLVGSHVKHNVYFKEFPKNVPDTREFWFNLVTLTYGEGNEDLWNGNLLELDGYGNYLHTFEEMVAVQEKFKSSGNEKVRILHLGGTLDEEATSLYKSLAESKIPLSDEDKTILVELAGIYFNVEFDSIPQRETRSLINLTRIKHDKSIIVDNLTDVLRLGVALSEGDVSLQTKTKFKSLPQAQRRILLSAISEVLSKNPSKIGDIYKNREVWKRFAFRLNSKAVKNYPGAQVLFNALYEGKNVSFEALLEKAFNSNDMGKIVAVLANNSGLYARNLNRVLLNAKLTDIKYVVETFSGVSYNISTPVLIGLAQYLRNRTEQKTNRVFLNRKGTGHVVKDTQAVLPEPVVEQILAVIDKEVASRLPEGKFIVSDDIQGIAIPLSNKLLSSGLDILPRGSVDTIKAGAVRYFIYWKEKEHRTDYDLSGHMLDENFNLQGQVSFTNLRGQGITHSGDITSAPNGASEFIDVQLDSLDERVKHIVPQVNIYAGENFDDADEAFFGYMEREEEQKGLPFEPKTVVTKSDLVGTHKVNLPLLFSRMDDGTWQVKWLHSNLKGYGWANATENNALSTAALTRAIFEQEYLTLDYLINLLKSRDDAVVYTMDGYKEQLEEYGDEIVPEDWTFIGRSVPSGLDGGVKTITLPNIHELIP